MDIVQLVAAAPGWRAVYLNPEWDDEDADDATLEGDAILAWALVATPQVPQQVLALVVQGNHVGLAPDPEVDGDRDWFLTYLAPGESLESLHEDALVRKVTLQRKFAAAATRQTAEREG